MKIRSLSIILCLCLGFSPLTADNGGETSVILEEYINDFNSATNIDKKTKALGRIVVEASFIDMNIAKVYLGKLESIAATSNEPIAWMRLYNVKGVMSYTLEEPLDTILNWYSKALEVIRTHKLEEINSELALINNRAITFERHKMHNKAIKEYTSGLDMLHNLKERSYSHETLFYANIANMLLNAKRYDEALEYVIEAEATDNIVSGKLNKPSEYFEYILVLKGEILYNLKRFDEAESELTKMLQFETKVNLTNNWGQIVLGKVYAENNKVELANSVLYSGLNDAIELDLGITNQVLAGMSLAKIELAQDNATSALKHINYVYDLYQNKEKEIDDSEIHGVMAKVLERSGRFEESLHYTKEFQKLRDIEKEEESNIKFGEFEQKLIDIENQYKFNELEINQKLQESRMSMLIIAFILTTILLFFLYYLYNRKKQHNLILLQKNKEITLAKDKALAAAKAKENFLATMSHEMRTPMNAIIGITNLLIDENSDSNQRENLHNLKFSGEGLLHIINEVLDFSKIEASKLEIVHEEFCLQDFLDSMINSIKHGNNNQNVKIFQDQQLQSLQHFISGDKKRIKQILTNLLSNAIKFTNEGHIVLRSRIKEVSKKTIKIIFQVEDSGIGIPSDKMECIFDSFSQVNNNINRIHQGTGLGLAISKKLVELQGGEINVKSIEGKGSTFSFILEFEKTSSITQTKVVTTDSKIFKAGIEGKRILLVEDNKLNQLVALKVLKKFKVETSLAQNGQEAVDKVSTEDFDLILMDIHMPIMDGIEATEKIRALADPRKNTIPIIALSADAYSDKVREATKSGMNDYQSKPFKPEELFKKIKNNLSPDRARLNT